MKVRKFWVDEIIYLLMCWGSLGVVWVLRIVVSEGIRKASVEESKKIVLDDSNIQFRDKCVHCGASPLIMEIGNPNSDGNHNAVCSNCKK